MSCHWSRPRATASTRLLIGLVAGAMVCSCATTAVDATTPAAKAEPVPGTTGQDAAPAPVPPNRCLAVGTLLSAQDGPDRTSVRAPLPRGSTGPLSTLQIRIHDQRAAIAGVESLCVPGATLTVLAARQDWSAFVGKRIEAELELVGTTAGRHWWLHRLSVLTPRKGTRKGR